MKTKFTKRILNIVLALVVLVSYMPTTSFAADFLTDDESVKEAVVIAQATAKGNKQVKLSWLKTEGATYYKIVGNYANYSKDKVIVKKTTKTSYVVKRLSGKKLKSHKLYRFVVKAYNDNKLLETSNEMHIITANTYKTRGRTYGNVVKFTMAGNKKAVVLDTRTVDLRIGYPLVKIYKNKYHLRKEYSSKYRFVVESPSIIDVDTDGKITPKKIGKSNVYVQAVTGKYLTINVTVAKEVHTIKFNKNAENATGTMADQKVPVFDTAATKINQCAFTRPDYTFAGWAVTSAGSVKYSDCAEIKLDKDIELFAVWEEPTTGGGGGGNVEPVDKRTDLEKAKDKARADINQLIEQLTVELLPSGFNYVLSGDASAEVAKYVASAESDIDKAETTADAKKVVENWHPMIANAINKDVLEKYKPVIKEIVSSEASKFTGINDAGKTETISIPEEFWSDKMKEIVKRANDNIDTTKLTASLLEDDITDNYIEDKDSGIDAQHAKESYVIFKNSINDEVYYQVFDNEKTEVLTAEPISRFKKPEYNISSSNAHPIGGKIFSFIGCTENAAKYVFYDTSDNAIFEASGNTLARISSDAAGNKEYIPVVVSAEGLYNEISAAAKYSVSGKKTYFDGWSFDKNGAGKNWLTSSDSVSAKSNSESKKVSTLITLYAMWETDDQFYVAASNDNGLILPEMKIQWAKSGTYSFGPTKDGIGNGRRNTVMALSELNKKYYPATGQSQGTTYLWLWIDNIRKSTNGCNDWYIGTPAEQIMLINSKITSADGVLADTSSYCWTSVQDSTDSNKAYIIGVDEGEPVDELRKVTQDQDDYKAVAIRSF